MSRGFSSSEGSIKKENSIKKEAVPNVKAEFKVEITKAGTGENCKKGDNVKIHYTGKLDDGTVFDSSVARN